MALSRRLAAKSSGKENARQWKASCIYPESISTFSVVDYLQHLELLEFKRKKRAEERTKDGRKVKENLYEDYPCAEQCEDVTKLKKVRVSEYIYLKYQIKDWTSIWETASTTEKVKVIVRHIFSTGDPVRTSEKWQEKTNK